MNRIALGVGVLVGALALVVAFDLGLPQAARPVERRDASGRLESIDTGSGWVKRFRYNAAGLPVDVRYMRKGRWSRLEYPTFRARRMTYDAALRLTELEDDGGRTTFKRNSLGLLASAIDSTGIRLAYSYDPWQNPRSIELPGGRKLEYRFDSAGRMTRVIDGDNVVVYEHDADRKELRRRLPNGIVSLFRWNEANQIALIRHARGDAGDVVLELRYQHDSEGRISSIDETTSSGTKTTSYAFDALGRLVRTRGPDGAADLAYDPDGNLIRREDRGGAVNYEYRNGELVRAGELQFEYDAGGRLVAQRTGSETVEFRWSADGELDSVRRGSNTVRYSYDGRGLRVRRRGADGAYKYFVHNLAGVLPEVVVEHDGKGHLSYDILGMSRVGRRSPNGAPAYFLEDHLGSTRVVVDSEGRTTARYDYSEFGVPSRVEGTMDAPYLYAGAPYDPETGLIFLRSRYYDPRIGRFISPDFHPPSLENPQSLNRYAYCENDPVDNVDPTGFQPWKPYAPPPPPPPQPFYDPMRELWWLLRLHQLNTSFQLFRPPVLPPIFYEPWEPSYSPPPPPPPVALPQPVPKPRVIDLEWTARFGLSVADWAHEQFNWESSRWAGPMLRWAGRVGNLLDGRDAIRYLQQGKPAEAFVATVPIWVSKIPVYGPAVALLFSAVPPPDTVKAARGFDDWQRRALRLEVRDPLAFAARYEPAALQMDLSRRLIQGPLIAALHNLHDAAAGRGSNPSEAAAPLDYLRDRAQRYTFFPPPPPPGGPGTPLVGGVYLDETARILGELGDLTGAVFDRTSGRLVLLGDRRHTLPPMKLSYLAAAIRAVYRPSSEAPGMTIDPNPEDPRGPTMLVRFFSHTEQTDLGDVMFEADRLLKTFSVGVDNLTKIPVASSVPGYENVAQRQLDAMAPTNGLWSRFWIVPAPVTARAADGAILFDPVQLQVQTQTMRWSGGKLVPAGSARDPIAEDFAAHFSAQYDAFAKEQPVFAELKQVTQAVALARFLKDRGVPADWGFVDAVLATPFPTPKTTPAAYNEVSQRNSGYERSVRVVGGVEMQPVLQVQNAPEVADVARRVLDAVAKSSEPLPELTALEIDGREQVAVTLPSAGRATLGVFETSALDLPLPGWANDLADLPGFKRHHHAARTGRMELGHGWSLRMPRLEFEVDPETGDHAMRTIGFEGMASTVTLQRFVLTDGARAVRFVRPFADPNLGRVGFAPEQEDEGFRAVYPEPQGMYRVLDANGNQTLFDERGRLRAIFRGAVKAVYAYGNDDRLDSVVCTDGARRLDARFEHDEAGRISSMQLGPHRVSYEYSPAGDLIVARRAEVTEYRYDGGHRLLEIAIDGRVVRTQKLDLAGRVVELSEGDATLARQSFESTARGLIVSSTTEAGTLRSSYDERGRPQHLENPDGSTVDYEYVGDRSSREVTTIPGGGRVTVAFSEHGAPTASEDAAGSKTEFKYLADRRVAEVIVDGERFASFDYGQAGLERIRYRDGYEERFIRARGGQVVAYARSKNGDAQEHAPMIQLVSVGERTHSVTANPVAPTSHPGRVEEDGEGRPTRIDAPDGTTTLITYGHEGGLEVVRVAGGRDRSDGARTKWIVDRHGDLTSVQDPFGNTSSYSYGNDRMLTSVQLPSGRRLAGDAVVARPPVIHDGVR